MSFDDWDPLHSPSAEHLHWSTDNLGEAVPGVLTPLNWTLWGPIGERSAREAAYRLGALTRSERKAPEAIDERILRIFCGRVAMQLEFLATIGDRMPGTSGQEVARSIFGRVPQDIAYAPTVRRYPIIAHRTPYTFATTPRRVWTLAAETDRWWLRATQRAGGLARADAVMLFEHAAERFERALTLQTVCLLGVVQPLFELLTKLVEQTGIGDVAVLSGSGGAEMAVITGIWRAARGESDLRQVIAEHGFHGPLEGELSSRVWREDAAPLERLVAEYAERPAHADPRIHERLRAERADEMRRAVLAQVPAPQRPATRLLLRLAAERIPLRGVAKRSFLQALDAARAAARRAGECLVLEGKLDAPEDVFYLTRDELSAGLPRDAKELVARRRNRRAEYQEVTIPGNWTGAPVVSPVAKDLVGDVVTTVTGIGVSAGTVEGRARIVTSPDFCEVEPDEVLVAPTTDPSWSSVMFISSALVVDIGGTLSHAAVVARELGIPCVVNTRTGTRQIRSGDRVRVDGANGTVEILQRAPRDARTNVA